MNLNETENYQCINKTKDNIGDKDEKCSCSEEILLK